MHSLDEGEMKIQKKNEKYKTNTKTAVVMQSCYCSWQHLGYHSNWFTYYCDMALLKNGR